MKLKFWGTAALTASLLFATALPSWASQEEVSEEQLSAEMGPGDMDAEMQQMEQGDNAYGACDTCDTCNTCSTGSRGGMLGQLSGGRNIQLIAGAEYIYAQATFSDALAFIEQDVASGVETWHQIDFDYDSSYSFYGGAYLPDCGGAVIFDYTRLTSSGDFAATDSTFVNIFGDFEVDGDIEGGADVDLKSYDLSFSKTIPLGCLMGGADCGECCDDACGCGWCPAWDITWSGGIRYADVEWNKFVQNTDPLIGESGRTALNFDGFGGRVGLMGRRYIGKRGLFSLYGKGDWSVLFGDVDIATTISDLGGSAFINTGKDITVPVTEVELGASAHLGTHATLSAGYFWAAWHDLGMSQTTNLGNAFQVSHYDDANILGWNGFFARAEVAF